MVKTQLKIQTLMMEMDQQSSDEYKAALNESQWSQILLN